MCNPSISDAHIYLEKMKTFAQHQGHANLLEHSMISCDIVDSISVTKSKQTTITDFLNQIECKKKIVFRQVAEFDEKLKMISFDL